MCSIRNFMATDRRHKYWRMLTGVWLLLLFASVSSAQSQFEDTGPIRKRFDTGMDEESVEYLRMSPAERSAEFSRETKEIRIASAIRSGLSTTHDRQAARFDRKTCTCRRIGQHSRSVDTVSFWQDYE